MFAAKRLVTSRVLVLVLPVLVILAVAGAYEIFEWLYALTSDPEAGAAVLGSQGDVWDAQKDMLADTLGAVVVMVLFAVQFFRTIHPDGMGVVVMSSMESQDTKSWRLYPESCRAPSHD